VVLLDLNLPDIDGLQVCRAINGSLLITVLMPARDSYEDKARGFADGADDYLTKPFDLREVQRLRKLARRRQLHDAPGNARGAIHPADARGYALYRDAPLPLTQTGFKILLLLCREHPHAVSRSALLQALWGSQPPHSDAFKSHIYALRKRRNCPGGSGAAGMLVTIPQLGYRLAFDGAASDG
jgi:DNA-binding response OmpR family regulator